MLWSLTRETSTFYRLGPTHDDLSHAVYGRAEWDRMYPSAEWGKAVDFSGSIVCPVSGGHQRPAPRTMGLEIVLSSPKIGDFVWTCYSECIVTERVIKLFREAGLRGFETRDVRVERVKRNRSACPATLPRLYEFRVLGRAGHAHARSGIRKVYECTSCGLIRYSSYRHGIIVDENQWDGSDFFTVTEYPTHILVTPRVMDLIVRENLKPCVITPSDKLKWPWGVLRPESMY